MSNLKPRRGIEIVAGTVDDKIVFGKERAAAVREAFRIEENPH